MTTCLKKAFDEMIEDLHLYDDDSDYASTTDYDAADWLQSPCLPSSCSTHQLPDVFTCNMKNCTNLGEFRADVIFRFDTMINVALVNSRSMLMALVNNKNAYGVLPYSVEDPRLVIVHSFISCIHFSFSQSYCW